MQHEITQQQNIFEQDGTVQCAGWAKNELLNYNVNQSAHSGKQCEHYSYFINNDEVSLFILIENARFSLNIKIAVADLKCGGIMGDFVSKKFILNKNELFDNHDNTDFFYSDNRIQLQISNSIEGKLLKCDFIDYGGSRNLHFNVLLSNLKDDALNVIAPFERDRKYYYYKNFCPYYSADGNITVGGMEYNLDSISTFAYCTKTYFSKPRKHNYQMLATDCKIRNEKFSICLASRVGDNRYGNENCFFTQNKLVKLSNVNVKGTKNRIDRPWYFKAGISALDIMFKPFTIKGNPMSVQMESTTIVFGRLYGQINHTECSSPIILDNTHAHMVFSEF